MIANQSSAYQSQMLAALTSLSSLIKMITNRGHPSVTQLRRPQLCRLMSPNAPISMQSSPLNRKIQASRTITRMMMTSRSLNSTRWMKRASKQRLTHSKTMLTLVSLYHRLPSCSKSAHSHLRCSTVLLLCRQAKKAYLLKGKTIPYQMWSQKSISSPNRGSPRRSPNHYSSAYIVVSKSKSRRSWTKTIRTMR